MGEAPIIRPAERRDLDAVGELQARSIMALGVGAYGREACEAWARMGRQVRHALLSSGTFFVAERNGALLGIAGWTADSREADCAWARYVFVEPAAAGRGVGRRLMGAVEQSAKDAGRPRLRLWSSLNAVPFYEALGYGEIKPARWPIAGGLEMEHRLMEKAPAEKG
jgi:GNAT superfamily N-acetyltransferase